MAKTQIMSNTSAKNSGQKTFRLAFAASMLSLEIMSEYVPLLGASLWMLPFMLIWVVSGFRFALAMAGLSLIFQIPNIITTFSTSTITVQTVSQPNWFQEWILSLPPIETEIVLTVVIGLTVISGMVFLYNIIRVIRVHRRLRPILVRLGVQG